jgi:Adenylyl/Guanylyl and SMODS C-terminal sensor domain
MGSAASLFYSANDSEKQTLHRRVTPSDEQFEEQQDRWNALADHLTTDLKDRSDCSIRTWLQGSYKFATQTRPVHLGQEFDIDLGVYFEWEGNPEDGRHGVNTLRSFVQESLKAYARANVADVAEVTPPKTCCSRIRFKNGFHIDIPAYHLDPKRDARRLATKKGWEDSDPKAIYLWFRNLFDDATRAKVRRQVRYLKAWARLKFTTDDRRPSSILLTVLVADAAKAAGAKELGMDDDNLGIILDEIVRRLENDVEVLNPVNKSEDLARLSNGEMTAFIDELKIFLDVAKRAAAADTELGAADIWQESFEHLFPMPEVTQALTKAARQLPAPSAMPEIKITAVAQNNPSGGRFVGMNQIGPIPKDCKIYFEITNAHALPANSHIIWMVRNEGREAENINDLGHFAGTGLKADERSAYRGIHYMDCIVKVGGSTVAMRRVPVTITGQLMPRRNPLLRPEWVKLRGRR